jgi:hypothetical protein
MSTDKPGKRGRKTPPSGESKRDRFVRLGEKRVLKAVEAISLIGNLSAPHYDWNEDDLDKMHTALMDAIERTFARFETKTRGPAADFKL